MLNICCDFLLPQLRNPQVTHMADSKPALPRVFAYPVRYTPRSTDAALAATTLLLPHGFLIDGSPSGLQTTIAERLAMLQRPRADTADLFFGFLPLYGPPMSTWTEDDHRLMHSMGPEREDYIPISLRVRVHRMCEQLGNSTLMRTQLPHLTRRTLKRHVLVTPFVPHACDHEARLTGRPFPPRREWLSHIILELNVDNLVSRDDIRHRRISMPYLSSVRWSRAWQGVPPWQRAPPTERNAAQSRSHLVSFTGSLRGQPISMQLRTRLVASCRARAAHVCAAHVSDNFPILAPEESSDAERMSMRRALRLKLHSTFCLEPPGEIATVGMLMALPHCMLTSSMHLDRLGSALIALPHCMLTSSMHPASILQASHPHASLHSTRCSADASPSSFTRTRSLRASGPSTWAGCTAGERMRACECLWRPRWTAAWT